MTQPTPAQIEATALELSSEKPWPWDCCLEIARLRLTAAAEVGEQTPIQTRWYRQGYREGVREAEARTIERCAQVAENSVVDYAHVEYVCRDIAAAIRALKDK